MLGEQHPARDLADLMAGPADALQAAGHRRRRLHLDHQVDGAHIDAQFQARRRHHRLELPALEILFHQSALFLADRTVVRTRQHRVGAQGLAAAHDVCRCPAGHLRVDVHRERVAATFGVNLVEPCGKSLSQPS